MHTHDNAVVHDGLRGWRVLDDGSVREFTLAHACSEPGDEREIREGRLYFHDLFAQRDTHGVRVPPNVEFHLALPTGELLRTRDGWRWVSVAGWTSEVALQEEPVASANGFLLAREKGRLRTLAFEPPMCQHTDWRRDVTGAEDGLLYRSVVWEGAAEDQLHLARFPYYVTARLVDNGVAFTNTRVANAGTAARTAALRVGQQEVVANDTSVPEWREQCGTSWTTLRVRGAKVHTLCASECDNALAFAVADGSTRVATHKQMFCAFLVCVYGLQGRTVSTQLAIQYLVRVTQYYFHARAESTALAWMAFVLLQEKRDLRVRRIVARMQLERDATEFTAVQAGSDQFWSVVREYQRTWPLSSEYSASFALAIGAPRDPQQHSLYLPIEPRVDARGIPLSVDGEEPSIGCIETGVSLYRLWRESDYGARQAMVRNHAFPWHTARLRHRLLRTVAVCAALHLFRYPTWLRAMELYWVIDVNTRLALERVPYQTTRYALPKDEAMLRRVEEELWAFFRAAYAIYRGFEADAHRINDQTKGTSSLAIAMRVREKLESHVFTRIEYRLAVAQLFVPPTHPDAPVALRRADPRSALTRVFPDAALWTPRDRRMYNRCSAGWCRSKADADLEALRDTDEQEALRERLRNPPVDHPTALTWNILTIALGMNQAPLFYRVHWEVDAGFFDYKDRLLLVLPGLVSDIENGHVPATFLPPLWSV